jgi:hypothetical protein
MSCRFPNKAFAISLLLDVPAAHAFAAARCNGQTVLALWARMMVVTIAVIDYLDADKQRVSEHEGVGKQ